MTNSKSKSKNNFSALLRNYELAARTRNGNTETETAYTNALTDLATACAFSVLKKLCSVSNSIAVKQLRQSLARDLHNIDCIRYASNNATALKYNNDGEIQKIIINKDLHNALTDLCKQSFGDGIDLMHTAIVTILKETQKATDLTAHFMEIPYKVRRLKRKVYIKEPDAIGGYETVTTTPIQEVYKAIRRDIESNRTIQTASNKYTYLESITIDTESDAQTNTYRRLPKYSGLAYEITDYNGKVTSIATDANTVSTIDYIIERLNLTKKQATILQLRLSGYGNKAIATYLGISLSTVKTQLKALQAKATAIGLTPTK